MGTFRPKNQCTPAAAKRWGQIPKEAQGRIMANVWCGNCVGSVDIVLETAEMMDKALILRGKCKACGKTVCARRKGTLLPNFLIIVLRR